MSTARTADAAPQMCMAGDLPGQDECLRVAMWKWQPDPDQHPLFLCNFHAGPLLMDGVR